MRISVLLKHFSFLGDCCLPFIETISCEECICHEDGTRHPENPCEENMEETCQEKNNKEECNYDEGDF